jgi:integrase
MKPVTRDDLQARYGAFLQFLCETGELDPSAPAGGQVTPARVGRYIERVRPLWSSVTVAQSIYKLRRMTELLSGSDYKWLSELERDLANVAYPKERFTQIVTSEVLIEAGLTLVREAQLPSRKRPLWRATSMRDGLMVALLGHHPIRLKNFVALELGMSFVRNRDDWWIVLGRRDTKTGRPDERVCDESLRQAIALYLTWARPRLLGVRGELAIGEIDERGAQALPFSGPLWVGEWGKGLGYEGTKKRIVEATRVTIGVPISPHDFRRNAATTAAVHAGSAPNLGSSLLQHTDARTTEEYYNRASNMAAAVEFGRMISDMRKT